MRNSGTWMENPPFSPLLAGEGPACAVLALPVAWGGALRAAEGREAA